MVFEASVQEAAEFIRSRVGSVLPSHAIILGSGLSGHLRNVKDHCKIAYEDIPNYPVSTVKGHAGYFLVGTMPDTGSRIIILRGRTHYYEHGDMEKVIFPVFLLHMLGVSRLIVTNAAGGVNDALRPGDIMLITDHINLMGTNPLIGFSTEVGTQFPDMTYAYDPKWLEYALQQADKFDLPVQRGVYAAVSGPSYETPAEIKMLNRIGADAVGMSTVPEVIAANKFGIGVLGISCITNMAAGILDQPLDHDEVIAVTQKVSRMFDKVIRQVLI